MVITIASTVKSTHDKILVEYSTPYEKGLSAFKGSPPKANQKLDVEINIDDEFIWGENLIPSTKNAPSISFDLGFTYITGELIAIEDDGCGILRIGDAIILISIEQKKLSCPYS